ncbi:MAG: DUF1565 domain-containing protein [Chloroflexi bacterium]|nr:DUF1565 domain-containing protein [Chloroflexota bacterium]
MRKGNNGLRPVILMLAGMVVFLIVLAVIVSGCGTHQKGTVSSSPGLVNPQPEVTFDPRIPLPPGAVILDSSGRRVEPPPPLDMEKALDPPPAGLTRDTQNHNFATGWNTMSFPFDSLTATTGFTYYLYGWDGSDYQLVNPTIPETVDCSKGFWEYAESAADISATGSPPTASSIGLGIGWNLFACPIRDPKDFSKITITNGASKRNFTNATSYQTDPGSAWGYAMLFYFNNGFWYQLRADNGNNVFQPWYGYWFFSWNNSMIINFTGPVIDGLSPSSGYRADVVTINGTGFDESQGTSDITFNGEIAMPATSWSDTQITCRVPDIAATGPVVVTVNGTASNNEIIFTVKPTLYVDMNNGSDDNDGSINLPFKTITKAMGIAAFGTAIVVAEGTYNVGGGETLPIDMKNGVRLRGGYNAGFTMRNPVSYVSIIDGTYELRCVLFTSAGNQTEISGFTIQNGVVSGTDSGGGIYVNGGGPVISDCILTGNSAYYGGGICSNNAAPAIINCLIYQNSGSEGAGVYLSTNSSSTITNCTIAYNNAALRGGGLYCSASDPAITNCIITNNFAYLNGGGIYAADGAAPMFGYTDLQVNTPDNAYNNNIPASGGFADFSTWGWNGIGCFAEDPQFFDFQLADYHLQGTSLCIDAGDPGYTGNLNGGAWETQHGTPDTGIVDMGFHFPYFAE